MSTIRELHTAEVVDTADPEKRGRIRVKCPSLLGDNETDLPMWVEPAMQWGWFLIPDVGDIVDIDIVADDGAGEGFVGDQASIEGPDTKWRGISYWLKDAGETNVPRPIHPEMLVNYGKRRGFSTPAGHVFVFDDKEGAEKITIAWKSKDAVATDNFIAIEEGKISVHATGMHLDLKVATCDIVDGADSEVVRGTELKTWITGTLLTIFNAHLHPTAVGPSGPPTSPLTAPASNCWSTKAKVK
jgi:hypothetical protein